jgi:hypothetical protein
MSEDRLIDIVKDVNNKSNKDLFLALTELTDEFNKTKDLILSLTKHLDNVENMYNIVNNEIGKRTK